MQAQNEVSYPVSGRRSPYGVLAEGSITVALAFILSFVRIFRMPQGGEISLEMVPLITFALLRGLVPGTLAGVIFGLLHFLQSGICAHPLQFILDYPCAFGALGLAGIFSQQKMTFLLTWVYVLTAVLGRLFFHTLSGVLFIQFFIHRAPPNPVHYSLIYNLLYLFPNVLVCAPLIYLVISNLKKSIR